MDQETIQQLCKTGLFQNKPLNAKLIETHISWVLLGDDFVFKIKKPLQLSFLDFSTLELRKHFCQQEIDLNSRFTDIYLKVVPICQANNQFTIGNCNDQIIDYAVMMKKLDEQKRMDVMAKELKITHQHIVNLAETITNFHKKATTVKPQNLAENLNNAFRNLEHEKDTIQKYLGGVYKEIVEKMLSFNNEFVLSNTTLIKKRLNDGWVRDLHGDLHMQNIFLYEKPILFDCIEFNTNFRQIDVLNEIAFLCMDLEANKLDDFSSTLFERYTEIFPCGNKEEYLPLFIYYKLYRANVRAKVTAIQLAGCDKEKFNAKKKEAETFLLLGKKYLQQLAAI